MKKIMFNDTYGLTAAVLNGNKTMTRRIIPLTDADMDYLDNAFDWDLREIVIIDRYAKYKVNEVVAVAQAYKTLRWPALLGIDWTAITYEVTHSKGWANKLFVKAEYMPHRIRITDIKIERLKDISIVDCLKEGIYKSGFPLLCLYRHPGQKEGKSFEDPKKAFAALIDKVSGKGTWESNPWVFAYSFELIE